MMRRILPCFAAALVVLAIGWWANPRFERLGEDDDTDDYVSIAHSFSDEEVRDRPPVYPLYLRLCVRAFGDRWERAAIAGQYVLLALTAAVLASVLRRIAAPPWAAIAAAAACCVTPGLLFMSGMVLPEVCLAMALALVWWRAIRLADAGGGSRRLVRGALLCGVLSGLAALVKPVWILGCLPLAACVLLLRRKEGLRAAAAAAAIVVGHAAVVAPWQLFLFEKYGQLAPSRTGAANVNMTAMRYGMTADAAGTPLYDYLRRAGLLDAALGLHWDDFSEFARIKAAIPWSFRCDPAFERAILHRDVLRPARLQLARGLGFFVVHPPPADRLRFAGLPAPARLFYARAYNAVFRIDLARSRLPVMPILLVLGLAACLAVRRARAAGLVSAAMLLYYATIVALLSYQDGLFIRMRIAVEPELLFLAVAPLMLLLPTAALEDQGRGGPGARDSAAPPGA
jgi:Dolichyl-phosphate-mannose-protein mannosyltransferase